MTIQANLIPEPTPDFVRFGNILDAVGASNPSSNLEYQKIELKPRNYIFTKPNMIANGLGNFFLANGLNKRNDDFVGETLDTLQQIRKVFGVKTLKEFFDNMKKMFKSMIKQTVPGIVKMDRWKKTEGGFKYTIVVHLYHRDDL